MQPSEHNPITPPPKPSCDEPTDIVSHATPETPSELTLSVGDRFRSAVLPPLVAAGNNASSSFDSPALQDFRKRLEDPELRAVAWEHIATFGLRTDLSIPLQQLLAKTLLPYARVDRECSWEGLCSLAADAVETGDMKTYELVGITALNAELPNIIVERLSYYFAEFETHSATQVPELAPWIKLFIEHGSDVTYGVLTEGLRRKIEARQLSSYDHILTVLCEAHEPMALRYFKARLLPPILPEQYLRPPFRLLLADGVRDSLIFMPLAGAAIYEYGGLELLGSQATPLLSLALGFGFALVRRLVIKSVAKEIEAENAQWCKTPHYEALLDRCVEKLCALPPSRADAQELLNAIEEHPALAYKRAEWQELRASSSHTR